VSIIDRFFGKHAPPERTPDRLVANAGIDRPLSLQVLFSRAPRLDASELSRALRAFDRTTREGRCDVDEEFLRDGKPFGLAGWGRHVVRFLAFDAPMPEQAVETCVAPAHYGGDLKQRARDHRAHIILYYAGYDRSPLEQYVALAVMAAVFGRNDGLVVLNEAAQTSLPVSMLLDIGASANSYELLRQLPLPYLYCGFVKHEVAGARGVWMRTYGAALLGLPDLAVHAAGHHEGQRHFDRFESVLRYVLEAGARLRRGHTMEIGTGEYMRLRAPTLDEGFLVRNGELFVMEMIEAGEINR
jgi:hypothetical protein